MLRRYRNRRFIFIIIIIIIIMWTKSDPRRFIMNFIKKYAAFHLQNYRASAVHLVIQMKFSSDTGGAL